MLSESTAGSANLTPVARVPTLAASAGDTPASAQNVANPCSKRRQAGGRSFGSKASERRETLARTVGNMYVSVELDAAAMRRQEAAREERRTAHAALPKRRLRAAQGPAAARTVCVSGPLVSDRLCQLTVRPNASVEWRQRLWRTSCSRLRHGSTLLPHQAPAGASHTIRCAGCLSRRQSELDLPAQPPGQDDVSKKATGASGSRTNNKSHRFSHCRS